MRYCVLRLKQLHIDRAEFESRFGFDVSEVVGPELRRLGELGLLDVTDEAVSLTASGILYVDDVCRTLYTRGVRDQLAQLDLAQMIPLRKSLV